MNNRHFLRKGDKDNEEVYQIFGSRFDSKENRPSSSSKSPSTIASSTHQTPECITVSSIEIDLNSPIKGVVDEKDKEEDTDENRFCKIILDSYDKVDKSLKENATKEIKVDYFQLARLSRKFQKMKQFYNFPFIKKFKFDIKDINELSFLEFIKSTQGEEFIITETNYYELSHLSNEWETHELTSILEDYGKRHENDLNLIIQKYIFLVKEYAHQKEEKMEKQVFKRRDNNDKKDGDHKNNFNSRKEEKHEANLKIKLHHISMIENRIKNRIEECFKTKIFWEIRIDIIHRLIKETSIQDYSHDSLLECIIESIEERKKLIELIDPCLLSKAYHKKLVDLQYNLFNEYNNNNNNRLQNNNYTNMHLFFEFLQRYQELNNNKNINSTSKFNSEEIVKLKRELEQKEKDIEQKDNELKELREREIIFCNEFNKAKENIIEERKEVKRKEIEVKRSENEVERSLREANKKEIENLIREEKNTKREEEYKRNEEKIENMKKDLEIKEKDIQKREENVERKNSIIENKEKENIRIMKEIIMKKEEIQKMEENIKEREKKLEESKNSIEKEKISFEKKMKEEDDKSKKKEKQQQELIDEFRNQLKQKEEEITQMKIATDSDFELFLKEYNLQSIDDSRKNSRYFEATHFACKSGNDKIVTYILTKNPSKLNAATIFILTFVLLFVSYIRAFNHFIYRFFYYISVLIISFYGNLTPLHLAVKHNRKSIVQYLVSFPNIEVNAQCSALHFNLILFYIIFYVIYFLSNTVFYIIFQCLIIILIKLFFFLFLFLELLFIFS